MVSEETRDEIFRKMREDAENLRCFDCDASDPQWATVTFGVFVCETCAGAHRDLGPGISYVRSLRYDIWNVRQLKVLAAGGNRACQQFFSAYSIQKQVPVAFKYKTKAAHYYSHLLSAVAEGQPCITPAPALDEGLHTAEGAYPSFEVVPVQAEEAKTTFTEVKDLLTKAVHKGEEVGGKLLDKINEASRNPTVKRVEDKTFEVINVVEAKVRHGAERIAQTHAFQSAKEKATQVVHTVGESAAYQSARETAASAARTVGSKMHSLYNRLWNKPAAPQSS